MLADYQVGYDDSGKITALKFDWHVDAGHSPDLTFFFVMALARAADECYYGLAATFPCSLLHLPYALAHLLSHAADECYYGLAVTFPFSLVCIFHMLLVTFVSCS